MWLTFLPKNTRLFFIVDNQPFDIFYRPESQSYKSVISVRD